MVCAFFIAFLLLSYSHAKLFSVQSPLTPQILEKLSALGEKALRSNDVPVASLLLYSNEIIGEGFNTVIRDSNAGGHAEINAISNALRRLGIEKFSKLNRDSLILISTFEPCVMCRGAILEYNIKRIEFLKNKPITHLLKEDLRSILYQWRRVKREPSALQDSLFHRHSYY